MLTTFPHPHGEEKWGRGHEKKPNKKLENLFV
jgi:hypothetical protein